MADQMSCPNHSLLLFLLAITLVPTFSQNGIEDDVVEFNEAGRETAITSTSKPPADPFGDLGNERSLDAKLDDLDAESQEIVTDYVRNGRKLNGDLRRRLILYVMKFSPVQTAVEMSRDASQIQKIERIKFRFRSGLRIKYASLKLSIDRLVAHLLAPIFAPFMLLQPDEVRPLFAAPQASQTEPVSVPSQEMTQSQSSFTALELFPSSLPHDKWPQFDQRWMNPQPTQFSVPSFTPLYQPFRYYRSY